MSNRSAAQTLFNRIIATWITPEVERRAAHGLVDLPFNLFCAFIVWKDSDQPEILLNEEVNGKELAVEIHSPEPLKSGDDVLTSVINGLNRLRLPEGLRKYPCIFILQGVHAKYYVLSQKMNRIVLSEEFKILSVPLAKEGLQLTSKGNLHSVYIDSTSVLYNQLSSPILKRKEMLHLTTDLVASTKRTATSRIRRQLRLPPILVHNDDEFLPLLVESRQTYIDGYFFSCIASTATTADRICIRLTHYYGRLDLRTWLLKETLGNKIQKLRAEKVITPEQEEILNKINSIRNKYLHPKQTFSEVTMKRDALKAVLLLHQLLEGTFSVYHEHTIVQGRIVPKRLV